ncbi:MAG: hypothetical protein IJO34_00070 [Akkermansia sp.]|nr:hypothetical protein [Akkermansia sp.]
MLSGKAHLPVQDLPPLQGEPAERHPVVFASDGRGGLMLGIALYSLLSTIAKPAGLRIVILDAGLETKDTERMRDLCHTWGATLQFISLEGKLDNMPFSKSFPKAACGRLLLPELMPEDNIVLYTDIDVLFSEDITPLLTYNLEEDLAAAVYEHPTYFNSGVMLLNLAQMRKEGTQQAIIDCMAANRNKFVYFDQDGLNTVMYGRVRALHPRWNWNELQPRKLLKRYRYWGCISFLDALRTCMKPSIRHFACRPKITEYNYRWNHELYRRIWLQSPWKNDPQPGERRLSTRLRRMLYSILDALQRRRIRHIIAKDDINPYPQVDCHWSSRQD